MKTVTVVARNQDLSARVLADLHEQGLQPTPAQAGRNAALTFQASTVAHEQIRYTEGWALEGGGRRFVSPQWHAWVTVRRDGDEHVVDVSPGWFDDPHALYAPLFTCSIDEALKHDVLPIHGEGPPWVHRPMDWPRAAGGTIEVTTFDPPDGV